MQMPSKLMQAVMVDQTALKTCCELRNSMAENAYIAMTVSN
jgi:hypothetical protein